VLDSMQRQRLITASEAAKAQDELKRRVFGGKLRRGDKAYRRIDYRPYRDLAMREAAASGIKLQGNWRLVVFIDAEFQRSLVAQLCSMTGGQQAAGVFMRPSGEVLALAGSCTYTGKWNRATDIARSIGSTGKLFPLIGVHEARVGLNTLVSTAALRRSNWPAEPSARCLQRRWVSLDFALAQSCNRPWTEMSIRLGQRLTGIVRRFHIAPPAPALVPIGGVQTSPLKLAQAYGALANNGRLPNVRFLAAAIGTRGSLLGLPATKAEPRVMSPTTAASVLEALRGPVKRGTARAANSVHALVYGKTGTSSRNEDALFVGLTEDFVGSLWLGHDRPTPMPGINGGGAPARAFSSLTDFYYVRRAQARFAESRQASTGAGNWRFLRDFGPRERSMVMVVAFVSMLMTCLLLTVMFRRRQRRPTKNGLESNTWVEVSAGRDAPAPASVETKPGSVSS
jgi:penicillin-binding protein 1A